jgi:CheY-like chemotaxis protein
MSTPHQSTPVSHDRAAAQPSQRTREIVIVDSAIHHYADFVAAARKGIIGLHFCADGRAAMRMAKRFRADIWLVAGDLPDMSGFDLLDMLAEDIEQSSVDPLRSGSAVSLGHLEEVAKSRVYVVADEYRIEDEQRALAAGVAGYRVRPVTLDILTAAGFETSAPAPLVAAQRA